MLKLIELLTTENSNILRHLLQKLSKEEVKRVLYSMENNRYRLPVRLRPESRHMS